ncbi:MAG: autoinducer binding domain-containing protein [Mesorhizobium sp.]|nr:autoinducer binding domain-containing protein [Mesorhizobium sp.]MCO5164705.1 autoinducer binding domain-containing protein [Mesorhizobium sp.]
MTERWKLDKQLGELIDAMETAQEDDTVRSALQTFTRASSFQYYAYFCFGGPEESAVTNYPLEWQELYLSNDYGAIDPVVKTAQRRMAPFSWSAPHLRKDHRGQIAFLNEAERHGICSGFTIPIKAGFGRVAMLTVAGEAKEQPDIIIRDPVQAATAVAFVHVNIIRLTANILMKSKAGLSSRELTCLTWASLGKTNWETAQMIGIAENTVRFYLKQARDKLGAKNIPHTVRLAVKRKII